MAIPDNTATSSHGLGTRQCYVGPLHSHTGADFLQIARTPLIYQELSTELAKLNRIQDKVSFKYMEFPSSMAAPDQPMWDIVVCDVVSPQGVLHTAVFEELVFLRCVCVCVCTCVCVHVFVCVCV